MKRGGHVAGRMVPLLAAALTMSGLSAGPAVAANAEPVAAPPAISIAQPGKLTKTKVRLDVRWAAATPGESPIHLYQLQMSLDGGPWADIELASRLARSTKVAVRPWQVVTFRVRAVDASSATGEWAVSESTWLSAVQEADEMVDLSAGWQTVDDPDSFGGRRSVTKTRGESTMFEFIGREIGWVGVRGPRRGVADVYLDGELAASVNLYRASTIKRRIVFRAAWPTTGPHTIRIVSRGSGARPTVDVDAFVVLSDPPSATLIGAGDIAGCADGYVDEATALKVQEVLDGDDRAVVFTAGDNVYPNGSALEFANCYDPSWGTFKARTRPVIGNHEYLSSGTANGYFNYFGPTAGEPGKGWYRYDVGTWRIYALNSECSPATTCPQQLAWLEANLVGEPHLCTLAIWHRPRWGPSSATDWLRVDPVWRVLADSGAEIVINGHNHMYARYGPLDADGTADPNGMRHFVVGTGGVGLNAYQSVNSKVELYDYSSHGVLRLDLAPGGYAWEFIPIAGDTFTDGGTGTCRA